ncbi:MAG: DUF3500 domain-containing protein [Pirellulales bacterium]
MRIALLSLSIFCLASSVMAQDQPAKPSVRDAVAPVADQEKKVNPDTQPLVQVKAFLETLTEVQKAKAVMPFESEKRVAWHFIPMATRKGLPLMEMNADQQAAAMKLMKACLSPIGYQKAEKTMGLEKLLKTIEGDKGQNERNPVKYYFTVFGTPAAKQRWGLSVEGHHLSLNFVFTGNKIVDSTPQFFASNPAVVKQDYDGFEKGLALLKPEEQMAFELVKSLSAEQLAKATLPDKIPTEIRNAGTPQPPSPLTAGIVATELDDAQRETLKKLLTAYTAKMKQGVAKGRWDLIEEAGWDKVRFAWSGEAKNGQGHYYVVQGPTFLVEFINVQADAAGNPANHIHCVWRDMTGDFDLPNP